MYLLKSIGNAGSMLGSVCLLETLSASQPCSTGWEKFEESCYLYNGNAAGTYDEAVQMCNGASSYLATIHSEAENTFVATYTGNLGATTVYLGLEYNQAASEYQWIDNVAVTYTNWRSGHGEASVDTKGACARLKPNNELWFNRQCDMGASVTCKAPAGT